MKTLSMLFGMLLMVGLMISPASAVNYAIDVNGNGTGDAALAIEVGNSTALDFYIEAYSCAPDDKLFGVQAYISYDNTAATISACSPNTAAQCDGSLSGCTSPAPGVLSLICSNFTFITVAGNKYKVGSATLTCDNEKDFNLTMANDVGAPYNDGFTSDCNLGNVFPTAAVVAVDQFIPPCECAVTPATAVVQSLIGSTVTQDFNAAPANQFCANPPVYVFSEDCDYATIDANTGLLSVPETTLGETCTVCATDTANTGTEPCCADVEIKGAITCSGEIYLGGAEGICSCVEQPPVDDPPYNRPGRRGLSLTCGDYVDFCACFDCEGTVDTTWTVTCTKPNLATVVETAECASRVTISDTMCDVLAETAECTVTVTDPVNNWTDSVVIQVGEIAVDLSEETVAPETDSVVVDISVTNNSNTIRAMDITIDEVAGDNLVCTSCVADPDRALNFTCTAAEQPDGSCRVVLFSPVGVINQGEGVVASVIYDVVDGQPCPDCVELAITAIEAADQFNEDLCACVDTGEVCFDVCGDIFPRDCLNPDCAPCGDGVVDLFDILEMVDIILAVDGYTATPCQLDNGNVPNGMPPYCGNPSGTTNCLTDQEINIFDLMVIIDMALGKANCCDYCTSGSIF